MHGMQWIQSSLVTLLVALAAGYLLLLVLRATVGEKLALILARRGVKLSWVMVLRPKKKSDCGSCKSDGGCGSDTH